MGSSGSGKRDLFFHPTPETFDYAPVLASLKEARARIVELMRETGPRNPMYVEAESLVAYIDAVARLTRVSGALRYVKGEQKTVK
jgi:hypothetical protein